MTPGIEIHLAIAGEVGRVLDGGIGVWLSFGLLAGDVFPSRAVTLFALNAEGIAGDVIAVGGRGLGFEPGGVTLQTAGDDGALEVGYAVAVAGTVDPAHVFPIGDGELEELVFIPEEIGLSFFSGTDDEGETFAAGVCGLEEAVLAGVQVE